MKNTKHASPILAAFIALIALSCVVLLPIDDIFLNLSYSDFQAEYIGLSIKMIFIFIISYLIIHKLKIESIAGISSNYKWTSKHFNLIPLYLIVIGIMGVVSKDLTQINMSNLALLLFACLTVGFAEEFLFRGILQSIFLNRYIKHKNGILIGILAPAIIFGLFHLINLKANDNVLPVLIQVVFATFIGFFFGVLVIRTNKLVPIAITHGLINFFFSLTFLPAIVGEDSLSLEESGVSIAPIILTLPLLIIGLLVVKKIKNEDVTKKLNESFL